MIAPITFIRARISVPGRLSKISTQQLWVTKSTAWASLVWKMTKITLGVRMTIRMLRWTSKPRRKSRWRKSSRWLRYPALEYSTRTRSISSFSRAKVNRIRCIKRTPFLLRLLWRSREKPSLWNVLGIIFPRLRIAANKNLNWSKTLVARAFSQASRTLALKFVSTRCRSRVMLQKHAIKECHCSRRSALYKWILR